VEVKVVVVVATSINVVEVNDTNLIVSKMNVGKDKLLQ